MLEEQDPKAGEAKFSLIPIPEVATMPWWSTLHLVLSSLDVKGRSYHLHNLMQLTLILGFDFMTIMFDAIEHGCVLELSYSLRPLQGDST